MPVTARVAIRGATTYVKQTAPTSCIPMESTRLQVSVFAKQDFPGVIICASLTVQGFRIVREHSGVTVSVIVNLDMHGMRQQIRVVSNNLHRWRPGLA